VTASDVARSLGLSRATVGFVLNDTPGQTISPATRQRVIAQAARLGYRPHQAARILASGQSRVVLLILPDWPIERSIGAHLDEASLALDEAGYSLVTWTPHAGGRARPLWDVLEPDVIIGMVPFTPEQAQAIARSGAKVVVPEAGSASPIQFGQGPALQIRHLAERGHRQLAYATTTDPRLAGLAEERYALARDTARKARVRLTRAPLHEDNAQETVAHWLDKGITGVAAYNDDIAALATGAAIRQKIKIPRQLAIIGHDDTPIARLMLPSLSTIHIDTAGLGRYVAALALHAATDAPEPEPGPATTATVVARDST
jgi:DNA-binding LacI/PurR family transcriptional regulator